MTVCKLCKFISICKLLLKDYVYPVELVFGSACYVLNQKYSMPMATSDKNLLNADFPFFGSSKPPYSNLMYLIEYGKSFNELSFKTRQKLVDVIPIIWKKKSA